MVNATAIHITICALYASSIFTPAFEKGRYKFKIFLMLFIKLFCYVLDGNIFDFKILNVICVNEIEKHVIKIEIVKRELNRNFLVNIIDGYINKTEEDVTAEGIWQKYFTEQPAPFTEEDKKAYLATIDGVALGSDAFFPFDDNIKRAKASGVKYIAEAGGSIRDDVVINRANEYGMVLAFIGIRLFHH